MREGAGGRGPAALKPRGWKGQLHREAEALGVWCGAEIGGPGHPRHMALGPRHRQGDPRKVRPHLPGPAGTGPSVTHRGKSRQPVTLGGTQAQVSAELGPRLQTGASKSPDWVREVPPAWLRGQTPARPQSGGGEQTPLTSAFLSLPPGPPGLPSGLLATCLTDPQPVPEAGCRPSEWRGPPPVPRPFSTARWLLSPQQ